MPGVKGMRSTWTPDRDEVLIRLWHEGLSEKQIGERMGLTASCVSGRCGRLKPPLSRPRRTEPPRSVIRAMQPRALPPGASTLPPLNLGDDAIPPWPQGCRDLGPCYRMRECQYSGCGHHGRLTGREIDEAVLHPSELRE